MALIPRDLRKQGYYFGGYEDGYYLKYHSKVIKVWMWAKPSQAEVMEEVRVHSEARRPTERFRRETDELYGPGTYDTLPMHLQKGHRGVHIVIDPGSPRSTTRLKTGEFPTVVTLGTRDLTSDEKAWFLAHELAHVNLGHGTRIGMSPQDALKEEEDAWRLAKYRNPSIPAKTIERALDTYRRIRGRGLTIARLRQHIRELSDDPHSVTEYLDDVITDSQTPDRVKLVAEHTLQRMEI